MHMCIHVYIYTHTHTHPLKFVIYFAFPLFCRWLSIYRAQAAYCYLSVIVQKLYVSQLCSCDYSYSCFETDVEEFCRFIEPKLPVVGVLRQFKTRVTLITSIKLILPTVLDTTTANPAKSKTVNSICFDICISLYYNWQKYHTFHAGAHKKYLRFNNHESLSGSLLQHVVLHVFKAIYIPWAFTGWRGVKTSIYVLRMGRPPWYLNNPIWLGC